jgi:hypothetical protein
MNVWFDNEGLYETFEDFDLSEFFEDDEPAYENRFGSYKGWKMRRL